MRVVTKTTDETDLQLDVDVSFWLGLLIAFVIVIVGSSLIALNVLLWKAALHA